jgi:chromosome segregation ATPase
MRQELRRGSGSTGFFAFQDVITSVIGIVLFIALLLSLFVGLDGVTGNANSPPRQAASPEDLARLESLLAQIVDLEDKLRQQKTASFVDHGVEIETLRADLALLQSQIEALPDNQKPAGTSPEVLAEIATLQAIAERAAEEVAEAERRAAHARTSLEDLEKKLEAAQQAKLAEEAKKNDIFLIPERARTTKSPVLLDVRDREVSLQTLDGRSSQVKTSASGDLKSLLREFDKTDYYVVIYFRPSTFHLCKQVLDAVRNLGFEIGYDMVREDQKVVLSSGGGQ